MGVRCTGQFKNNNFTGYVIRTSLSGKEQIREVSLPVRENGKLISMSNKTKAEARIILRENITLGHKMNTKISIENMIPKIQTEGIDEIEIVGTKAR